MTPALPKSIEIFDTTLRDGAQFEGISLTVDDREVPCPGPMTTAIAEEFARAVRGKVDRYKDWVEHA